MALVGGEELSLGFKIAGVHDSFTVETASEGENIIRSLLERNEVGIIIISSKILRNIKDRKILNVIDSSIMPIFIEVPLTQDDCILHNLLCTSIFFHKRYYFLLLQALI